MRNENLRENIYFNDLEILIQKKDASGINECKNIQFLEFKSNNGESKTIDINEFNKEKKHEVELKRKTYQLIFDENIDEYILPNDRYTRDKNGDIFFEYENLIFFAWDISKFTNNVKNSFYFKNCIFIDYISLFKDKLNFHFSKFENSFFYSQLDFKHDLILSDSTNLIFENTVFQKDIYFGNNDKKENEEEDNGGKITLKKCKVKEGVIIYENGVDVDFEEVQIFEKFKFSSLTNENKKLTITRNVNFTSCNFNCDVDFSQFTFKNAISFQNSIFNQDTNFSTILFKSYVNFNRAKFKKNTNFSDATFGNKVSFESTRFENELFFKNIKGSLNLDLKSTIIEKIDSTGAEIKTATNRETFLILKQGAIKQNDNISALDFHTKEMDKYYEELESKKDPKIIDKVNRLILCFEKHVSYYGTNPTNGLKCFFILNCIFFFINISLSLNFLLGFLISLPAILGSLSMLLRFQKNKFISFLKKINSIVNLSVVASSIVISWVIMFFFCYKGDDLFILKILIETLIPFKVESENFNLIHFIAFIVNPLLLYEIIKSFRKYSRKL